ncbi:hypothetical protein PybrP1_002425 [[Pythium] brassicae (nom. inval.)]|nr:hypothetical protein PybrP1_002425 [[Pythium] brassicae (nom. inval.)]
MALKTKKAPPADAAEADSDAAVARALADAYAIDAATASDEDVSSSPQAQAGAGGRTRALNWDERRRLALDLANLAPPDLPGALLLVRGFADAGAGGARAAGISSYEHAPPAVTAWDATVVGHEAPRSAEDADALQYECALDLDAAHPELLRRLRAYVDECYVPHYVPRENCGICEGLWSSGRVIACGNDACDTRIHEECFGVVLRESADGPWRCPSCLLGRQLMCAVCMQFGGALKPVALSAVAANHVGTGADDQKWVHTLCAMAIPELVMRDVPSMEPVEGFEDIENGRFRYLCGICRKRGGASIICEQEGCNVGMHPLCAANAGFMVGSDANPLAVFCEKHLPTSRILGAKRLISDEDLVEEIMSENNSLDEDVDEKLPALNESQRYAFILASTPFLYQKTKLLGDRATLKWGSSGAALARKTDLRAKAFANARLNQTASWSMPSDVGGWRSRRPTVFPPPASALRDNRIGLPPFPAATALVGAVVDFLVKEQSEWVRARVGEWDAAKQMHLVQIVATSLKLWATLSTLNTLVLYIPGEENILDGPRVRLFRPVVQGEALWRPKPRKFAAASSP